MKYNPDIHHRRSIRFKDYDYSRGGGYFVTVCTQGRECLFGEIKNGEMVLNAGGKMIENWWMDISKRFEGVERDEFIVMPNHFHGIVLLVGADRRVCPGGADGPGELGKNVDEQDLKQGDQGIKKGGQRIKQGGHIGPPLPKIIQWFKTMTTNEYLRNVEKFNWPPFPGRLWQRNYYEHIIRSEKAVNKIREYIFNNPLRWEFDGENPRGRVDAAEKDFWTGLALSKKGG